MTNVAANGMSVLAAGAAGRRRFSEAEKRRIVDEASQPGASVSRMARRYGIPAEFSSVGRRHSGRSAEAANRPFAPVQVTDAPTEAPAVTVPMIVERAAPGIEVELAGGRRVRFERDADPETVRRLIALLEGGGP